MPLTTNSTYQADAGFEIKGMMMSYNVFIPRLYNWCKSLNFEAGKIMPSRAFCADESQGYPIIMIAKHFGTFPFNHGRAGGIVATDRHGPHGPHGENLVIIQASHVGYDPQTKQFGHYRRLQTNNAVCSPSCGKIDHTLEWYQNEYQFAQQNIRLHNQDNQECITIDNQLLRENREEGLFLNLETLIKPNSDKQYVPIKRLSTAKVYVASSAFVSSIGKSAFHADMPQIIGENLKANTFYFQRQISQTEEGAQHLERNLLAHMPQVITSTFPLLVAAQLNTQIEFDRTFRTIVKEHSYQSKKVLFVAGLNIDISPEMEQIFPLTKFVPWAAYFQDSDGNYTTFEQPELMQALKQQSTENPDQIDLEDAIQHMTKAKEVIIDLENI